MSIPALYSRMERAVLAAYLKLPDPQPSDLLGIDVTKPVPHRWSERKNGIGPQRSEFDSNSLMLENAVARICLEAVQARLPQWALVQNDEVTLGRPRRRLVQRTRQLESQHLFTINWAGSGPGFSWPEAYYVTWLPGYGVSVVTASADSPDTHGYCDFAIGSFRGPADDLVKAGDCITTHWATQKNYCQERWEYLFETGAIDDRGANDLADSVWPAIGGDE